MPRIGAFAPTEGLRRKENRFRFREFGFHDPFDVRDPDIAETYWDQIVNAKGEAARRLEQAKAKALQYPRVAEIMALIHADHDAYGEWPKWTRFRDRHKGFKAESFDTAMILIELELRQKAATPRRR